MDMPWRKTVEVAIERATVNCVLPMEVADEFVAGRIKRPPKDDQLRSSRWIGSVHSLVLPSSILNLGLHPSTAMEVAQARGYNRWVTQAYLPQHPNCSAYIYLPFNDPLACESIIQEFAGVPGVAGFLVTSMRYQPIHDNKYMRVYAAIQDTGLPVAFHTAPFWQERHFEIFNQYLSAYAIGLPLYHIIHLINLVIHGIPERFPKLRCVFLESGLSMLPFVFYRLDSEYEKRPSEAPLLRKKPSEYIRDFYFTTHPLEQAEEHELEALFNMVGTDRLLYASNYPRWDFDLPHRIQQLSFLSDDQKADILGRNALKVFHLSHIEEVSRWPNIS